MSWPEVVKISSPKLGVDRLSYPVMFFILHWFDVDGLELFLVSQDLDCSFGLYRQLFRACPNTCGDRMDGVSTALGGLFDVFFPDVEWDWCCILLELHHVISVICTNNDGIFHLYIFAFTAICPLLCGWLRFPVYWLFGWCEGPSKHSWNYTWMSCTIMTPICIK